MNFVKMHGLGNDFIVVEDLEEKINLPAYSITRLCQRNFGIGADGLVLIRPSSKGHIRMHIFNSDGSEAEMCGNALRCVARYAFERGLVKEPEVLVETQMGLNRAVVYTREGKVESVEINMGKPLLESSLVPARGEDRIIHMEELVLKGGLSFKITALSMGNPHCVIFVEDCEKMPLGEIGPQIENHSLFPNKTNVELVEVQGKREIKMVVWERGVGETLACGSGACAAAAAAVLNNLTERRVNVNLPGGKLEVYWEENDGDIFLKGPAVDVYAGEVSEKFYSL
ncbi:MAG: diaminopimelate epimerase [Candidatus Syntrophonatronum acetioxidans]|uniref:Diaminopimelate epimerase n=1 Tax=Candidatus Syntrophonatronum acetioxidans TaxID=1795816 RepID=A0A424YI73_9FIRM|nr:MAG: diaminopimelate epimerase [Candidatus Syntrophonatronum acetioxidans]